MEGARYSKDLMMNDAYEHCDHSRCVFVYALPLTGCS
jgi:hypothetical protein